MSRLIVLDTETTGLSTANKNRIVEIGCLEIIDFAPTMNTYQQYINPERPIEPATIPIIKLSDAFLKPYPTFKEIADEFLDFIQDSTLVIHNANFDMGFLNYEMELCGRPKLKNPVIDTLQMARSQFPGRRANLDALCNYFKIPLTQRKSQGHGALLDVKLLTQVYLNMCSNHQLSMEEESKITTADTKFHTTLKIINTKQELEQHQEFIKNLSK